MIVEVKLFAAARQLVDREQLSVEVADGADVSELRRALGEQFPALNAILPHMRVAVDSEYVDDRAAVSPTAEVALIPPVSGG